MSKLFRDLKQQFQGYQHLPKLSPAMLGDDFGNIYVPNKPNYLYVRINGFPLTEIYNTRVSPIYNLPVLVGYDPVEPDRYQVLCVRNAYPGIDFSFPEAKNTEAHHSSHEYGNQVNGSDVVFSQLRQLMPLRPTPFGDMQVQYYRNLVWIGNDWRMITGSTIDYTPAIPATGAHFLLTYLNQSGEFESITGTLKDVNSLTMADVPDPLEGTMPLAAIRIYAGQTGIVEARTSSDLLDLRWNWMYTLATGTQNGHTILDAGTTFTQRNNLKFVGSMSVFDDPGTNTTIVSGTTSGAAIDHNSLSGLQGGGGGNYYHLSSPQIIGLVSGVSTALHIHSHLNLGDIGLNTHAQIDAFLGGSSGTFLRLNTSNDPLTAGLEIVGSANEVQLSVKGNATQTQALQDWKNSGGTVLASVSGAGEFGIGTAPVSGRPLSINTTLYYTGSAYYYGESLSIYHRPTMDSLSVIYPLYLTMNIQGSGTHLTREGAQLSQVYIDNFNLIDEVDGLYTSIYNRSTGTITNLYGERISITNSGLGAIGTAYGTYVGFSTVSGTVTNARSVGATVAGASGDGRVTTAVGLYIENSTISGGGIVGARRGIEISSITGATGSNYAIYTNQGLNRFGDQITIVGSGNRNQLQVQASNSQTGTFIQTWMNSAGSTLAYVSVTGTWGIGVTPQDSSKMRIQGNYTDPTIAMSTLTVATYPSHTAVVDANGHYGLNATSYNGGIGTGTNTLISVLGAAYQNGAGYINYLEGIRATAGCLVSGIVINADCLRISPYSPGNGYLQNLRGIDLSWYVANALNMFGIDLQSNTGASGTYKCGIRIRDISGASDENYAIFSDIGIIHFGDQITIHGSADRIQLRVMGNSTQTSNLQEWQNYSSGVVAKIDNNGNMTLTPTGGATAFRIGGKLSGASQYVINVDTTISGTLQNYGLFFNPIVISSVDTFGIYTRPLLDVQDGSTISNFYGILGIPDVNVSSKANVDKLYGGYFRVDNQSASGTVNNGYALYADNPNYTGKISGSYGVYIAGITRGSDKNYAIYTNAGDIRLMASSSDKLGLWGATPVAQPTTAIAASTFVPNTSGIVNDTATWDGYTVGQVVKALRDIGILA